MRAHCSRHKTSPIVLKHVVAGDALVDSGKCVVLKSCFVVGGVNNTAKRITEGARQTVDSSWQDGSRVACTEDYLAVLTASSRLRPQSAVISQARARQEDQRPPPGHTVGEGCPPCVRKRASVTPGASSSARSIHGELNVPELAIRRRCRALTLKARR